MNTWSLAFKDAFSFLTVLPFSCPLIREDSSLRMCRATAWFPLVGAVIGGAGAGVVLWAATGWPAPVAALLGLIVLVTLTGGLHLDGFADTVDGLAALKGREETLKIMRDPHLGACGAAGLLLVLGLKWSLIQALFASGGIGLLVVACGLSRWAMVLCVQLFPYAPGGSGLGRMFTQRRSSVSLCIASLLGCGITFFSLGPILALLCLVLTVLVVGISAGVFVARLGGITGDTLGFLNELVEVSILLLLARF